MRTRRLVVAVLLWLFGIATSLFYTSLWGRAVVADTPLLAAAAADASGASLVVGTVRAWIVEQLDSSGIPGRVAAPLVDRALTRPEVEQTLAGLLKSAVQAAAAPSGGPAEVDVGAGLQPLAPLVASEAEALGVALPVTTVSRALAGLPPLVVRPAGTEPLVGPDAPLTRALAIATFLGGLAMVLSGGFVIAFSESRTDMVRSLATRVAVGGITFAVLLRVGAWAVDPGGGREPVRMALAEVLRSKGGLLVAVAGAAAGTATVLWLVRTVRPEEGSPRPSG